MFSFLTLDLLFYLALGSILLNLALFVWLIFLQIRLSKVFIGSTGHSLEGVIRELVKQTGDLETFAEQTAKTLHTHDARIKKSIGSPRVLRFDAFHGTGEGGKQSFATALVSEDGDGMVLSSMYARDKMRLYAKPVSKFSSEYELTEEEQSVLKGARK